MAINPAQVVLQNAPRFLTADEINRIITVTPIIKDAIEEALLLKDPEKFKNKLKSEAIKNYIDWLCKNNSMPTLQVKGKLLRKAVQTLLDRKKRTLERVDVFPIEFAFNALNEILELEIEKAEAERQKEEWMAAEAKRIAEVKAAAEAEAKRLAEEKAAAEAEAKKLEEARAAKAIEDAKKVEEQQAAKENKGPKEVIPGEEVKRAGEANQAAESPAFKQFKMVFAELIRSQERYQSTLEDSPHLDGVIKQFESEKRGRSILGSIHSEFFAQNRHLVAQSEVFLKELKALEEDLKKVELDKGKSEEAIIIQMLDGVNTIYHKHIPAMTASFAKSAVLVDKCTNALTRNAKDCARLAKEDRLAKRKTTTTSLSALAICPVQRGPRFEMLAGELLKAASKSIEDFDKDKYPFQKLTREQMIQCNADVKKAQEKEAQENEAQEKEAPKKKANPFSRLFARALRDTVVSKAKEVKSAVEPTAQPQKAVEPEPKAAEKRSEMAEQRAVEQANRAKADAGHLPAMENLVNRLQIVLEMPPKSAPAAILQNAVQVLPAAARPPRRPSKPPALQALLIQARSDSPVTPVSQARSDSPVSELGRNSPRKSEPAPQTPPPIPKKKRRASAAV